MIPLAVKAGFTVFVAVLVPVYWRHYGPRNFLWFIARQSHDQTAGSDGTFSSHIFVQGPENRSWWIRRRANRCPDPPPPNAAPEALDSPAID